MEKISEETLVLIPEHINFSDPAVHYDAIREALQAAWWGCWSAYGFLRDQLSIDKLKTFQQLFPHGRSAQLQHVGFMDEIERRVNGIHGGQTRTGEPFGFKILGQAYNKALDTPNSISEAENIIIESQDRIVSLWDLLNQAAYRIQDIAGKISPVFHQLEFDLPGTVEPPKPSPPPPFPPPAPDANEPIQPHISPKPPEESNPEPETDQDPYEVDIPESEIQCPKCGEKLVPPFNRFGGKE
ncbi:MAG: hypothetical protein GY950_00815 [bacterium]|nr:hypothetical protein [bacterium]